MAEGDQEPFAVSSDDPSIIISQARIVNHKYSNTENNFLNKWQKKIKNPL
jgi:hypothetical protein